MNARASLAVTALLAAAVVFAPVRAAEEKKGESGDVPGTVKHAAKSVWEDTKAVGRTIRDSKAGQATAEAGREVGHAAAEAGRDTADVSRDIWQKTKIASVRAAHDVRDATVAFWNDVIRGKEDEAERLRKENERLKKEEGDE